MDRATSQPRIETERPRYPAAITEDLLTGSRRLRHAFLQQPICNAARDMPLVRLSDSDPTILLIRTGFAFRSCTLADGRRAILHIVTPGDVVGLGHTGLHGPIQEVTAAPRAEYRPLRPAGAGRVAETGPGAASPPAKAGRRRTSLPPRRSGRLDRAAPGGSLARQHPRRGFGHVGPRLRRKKIADMVC